MIEIDKDKPLTEGRFVEILNDRLGIKDECLVLTKEQTLNLLAILYEGLKRSKRKSKRTRSAVIGPKYKKIQQKQEDSENAAPETVDKVTGKLPPIPNRLIGIKEVRKRTGWAHSTIYTKIRQGTFPPYEKRGRSTFWRESVINAYVEGTWKPAEDEDNNRDSMTND